MSQYITGSCSVNVGGTTVSFSGTSLTSYASVGNTFKVSGVDTIYTIGSVDSDTQITLTAPWAGVTVTNSDYQITKDFTTNLALAEINMGDRDWPVHLTQEVIRKIDQYLAGSLALPIPVKLKDNVLYLADADVAHGMTGIFPTDVYGAIAPLNATAGCLGITGFSDTNCEALYITGIIGSTDPTDTTPSIVIRGGKKNGTSWQALAMAETVLTFRNYTTDLMSLTGDGVLAMCAVTVPTSSAADKAQLFATDINNAAGKTGLHFRNEHTENLIMAGILLKTSAGTPTYWSEGLMCINTSDNKIWMFADSAWRQLATW